MRLLDAERGGAFELAPELDFRVEREYVGDSNVLQTTFVTARGTVRVTDAITLDNGGFLPWFELVRGIEAVSGMVPMRGGSRRGSGRGRGRRRRRSSGSGPPCPRDPRSSPSTPSTRASHTTGTTRSPARSSSARASARRSSCGRPTTSPIPVARRERAERRFRDTGRDWERWLADAGVEGDWNAEVRRSALALRALTYVPTGAIVAAPSTSLPERIGGDRNYDYRYAWVRDTAFTLDALINLGLLVQVHASFAWLLRAIERTEPDLHVFYDLDGDTTSSDEELDGYRGSRPVRRGNAAAGQLQLGCYGDLLETADLYVREGSALDRATAARLADILDHLTTIWQQEDSGIWELPDLRHYTLSKIAVWTAFDRALRLVERGQLRRERAEPWQHRVEGAFVACSFWLFEALARAGRVAEGHETMRQVIGRANDVCLAAAALRAAEAR